MKNKEIEEKIKFVLDRWIKQGRTKEQVYGVQNFIVGAGLNLIYEIYQAGFEAGKKENIMALDTKVTKSFNKELKKESSELIKEARQAGRVEGAKLHSEFIRGKIKTAKEFIKKVFK